MAKGSNFLEAQQQAYGALEGAVVQQTYLLTYMDAFHIVGIFFLVYPDAAPLQAAGRTGGGAGVDALRAHCGPAPAGPLRCTRNSAAYLPRPSRTHISSGPGSISTMCKVVSAEIARRTRSTKSGDSRSA